MLGLFIIYGSDSHFPRILKANHNFFKILTFLTIYFMLTKIDTRDHREKFVQYRIAKMLRNSVHLLSKFVID